MKNEEKQSPSKSLIAIPTIPTIHSRLVLDDAYFRISSKDFDCRGTMGLWERGHMRPRMNYWLGFGSHRSHNVAPLFSSIASLVPTVSNSLIPPFPVQSGSTFPSFCSLRLLGKYDWQPNKNIFQLLFHSYAVSLLLLSEKRLGFKK